MYLLRHPVDRARSDYVHYRYPTVRASERWFDKERLPMERALLENPIYLDGSRYAMQLEQYLEWFDRDRILIVTTDELSSDPAGTVDRILQHIGVDPARSPTVSERRDNRTDEIRVPRPSFEWATQRASWISSAVARAPWRARRSIVSRRVPRHAGQMAAELRVQVSDLLRDDVVRLREHLGPDFHCWGLA